MAIAIMLGLATVVGGVVAALALLPRISVSPSDPVDSSNPFSASFTVANNNFVPLREVEVAIGIGQIAMAPGKLDPNFQPTFETLITRPEWQNRSLQMDERFTVTPTAPLGIAPSAKFAGADIAIVISFKPWLLPIKRKKVFRFIAYQQTNGQFYWYSHPRR